MDLTAAIAPKSDQLNADDLLTGPRTFTIEKVTTGSAEQPVNIHLAENPGRPWRPSKSMLRVLTAAWGKEGQAFVGRRVTLFRDPEVTFGRDKVGGIKVSHLSHIDKPLKLALTVSRGKRAVYTVQRLDDAPPAPQVTAEMIAGCTDEATLKQWWGSASPDLQPVIVARVEALRAGGEAG